MSEVIDAAVRALSARMQGGFDGTARLAITGEGVLMVDSTGVRAGEHGPAEVTLTASAETFRGHAGRRP